MFPRSATQHEMLRFGGGLAKQTCQRTSVRIRKYGAGWELPALIATKLGETERGEEDNDAVPNHTKSDRPQQLFEVGAELVLERDYVQRDACGDSTAPKTQNTNRGLFGRASFIKRTYHLTEQQLDSCVVECNATYEDDTIPGTVLSLDNT